MVVLLLAMASAARAAPPVLRVCSMDIDFAPYARTDGTGHLQLLTVLAARSLGMVVERHVAPRRRCLEELKAGVADAMIGGYSTERAVTGAFPMAGSEPDETKALGMVRYLVYRRAGTPLEWDGKRFAELGSGVVGVESAFALIIDRLRQLEVRFDDGSKSLEQNFAKLALARFDAVVAMDLEAERLIAAKYAGKIERAGKPFEQSALYLMLSHAYLAQNPRLAEGLWQAIAEQRASSAYRAYQQRTP